MPSSILVAEDQADIRDLIVMNLRNAGYEVTAVADGLAALNSQNEQASDLLILDLMMPGMDGLEVCKALRARGRSTPILMLTAKSTELDRVLGLELGADDYLTKPFSVAELLARIRVALRHRGTTLAPALTEHTLDDLHVDLETRLVSRGGEAIHLTPTEFKLLARLVRSAGRVVTHRQLLTDVWGAEFTEHTHYLRLYMGQLRAKIEADPAEPRHLLTETGVGYRLAVE